MINLETTTINKSKSNRITGRIYLYIDDKFFPEASWNDSSIIILNWWCETFLYSKVGRYSFMDGPFYFIISKVSTQFHIEAFHEEQSIFSNLMDIDYFKESLIFAIEALLNVIDTNDWKLDKDYEQLKKNLKSLKKTAREC